MRLAIITHEYYPVLSGGVVFTEQMARELTRMGWEVDVLTARIGSAKPRHERSDGFDVYRFKTARTSIGDSKLSEHVSYFVLGLPQMLWHARARKYDLLFSVFAMPSGLIAHSISKLTGVPSVVFVDAADTPGIESAMMTYSDYLISVFKLVTNGCAGVVLLEGIEDLARPHVHHERFTVIPNGALLPERTAEPGAHGPHLNLLSIGRLVFRKGFQDIIEALDLVRKERSDFRLNIVGYGRDEAAIRDALSRSTVADRVVLCGRVEYEKLSQYYLDADAYLFYGRREGSSLAMIDAAAYGLPIVASDHPGNRSYVKHGENGLLVEHGDHRALARAILELLRDRDRLPLYGRKSRALAEGYAWPRIAERYDAFFRRTIDWQRGA
jgi:glycosyltransferase involved in cell wall biosynthesis